MKYFGILALIPSFSVKAAEDDIDESSAPRVDESAGKTSKGTDDEVVHR